VLGTRTMSSTSAVYGSLTQVRNVKFTDACPDGMAIVGFTGNSGQALDALGVRCGTLQVSEDRSVEPFKYHVAVGTGIDFPPTGGTLGTLNMIDSVLLCGTNEVVVSVTTTTEPPGGMCANNGCPDDTGNAVGCPALYGLAVSCARYNITGTPGAFKLALASAPVVSMKAGGPASGETVVSSYACSATGVLRQASGAFGPWNKKCSTTVVTGMQFGCTDPTIPLR
jgi:hypothetical protein